MDDAIEQGELFCNLLPQHPQSGDYNQQMTTQPTNLADALFSKVRQTVLGLLYGNPEQSYFTNEIIRLTGSGRGAVQRELERLAAVELVNMHKSGKQIHYQANTQSPVFDELRGLVVKTFGIADVLKAALVTVAEQIQFAFIYGSVAKHQDKASSDIDIMLISSTLSYEDLYPLLEAPQEKLSRQINPTFYTPAEWQKKLKAKNNFVTQLMNLPKIFLIGVESEFNKLG